MIEEQVGVRVRLGRARTRKVDSLPDCVHMFEPRCEQARGRVLHMKQHSKANLGFSLEPPIISPKSACTFYKYRKSVRVFCQQDVGLIDNNEIFFSCAKPIFVSYPIVKRIPIKSSSIRILKRRAKFMKCQCRITHVWRLQILCNPATGLPSQIAHLNCRANGHAQRRCSRPFIDHPFFKSDAFRHFYLILMNDP